jgi:hypothetical protein
MRVSEVGSQRQKNWVRLRFYTFLTASVDVPTGNVLIKTISVSQCSMLKILHHLVECLWWTLVQPVSGGHAGNCHCTICWAESICALDKRMIMVHQALDR